MPRIDDVGVDQQLRGGVGGVVDLVGLPTHGDDGVGICPGTLVEV